MKKTNVKMIDASYVAPTVYVIEMASEGCLCGSIDRTESNDPDDYEIWWKALICCKYEKDCFNNGRRALPDGLQQG